VKINPVLKNEIKLSARSFKITLVILFYVGILSVAGLLIFNNCINDIYFEGLYLESIAAFYIIMAIIQAILLMFIVPSLTSTAICAEREKQTLEVLLSSKMSSLSIIIGKLLSSTSRVILLIICTIPIYSITFFIGGINLGNVLELSMLFIVATIFVGSIGVFISTFVKTSRAATAISYAIVLLIFVALVIGTFIFIAYSSEKINYSTSVKFPIWAYLSPTFGFISLLGKQLGFGEIMNSIYYLDNVNLSSFEYGYLISMGIQLAVSILLIFIAAYKLNPLHKGRYRRKK